ncbi:hypothetical protein STIAU_1169 [Stigmatella aurantiaca DW4/3-1]|uniref:Uncharacterized protein n=1 Tax=Stigmatella aurantiaca (strain DW4/3-1) TaxID=378806 RepID=Q08XH6_STIAD|nr:hypothetical protein STIAU_1169 [Stigmatella aurantiaca DW4/3-1]
MAEYACPSGQQELSRQKQTPASQRIPSGHA